MAKDKKDKKKKKHAEDDAVATKKDKKKDRKKSKGSPDKSKKSSKPKDDRTLVLKHVRLSFAKLLKPEEYAEGKPTYSATYLIDKDDKENIERAKIAGRAAMAATFGENENKWPKIDPRNRLIKNGDDKDYEGYADHWYISSKYNPEDGRPTVVTNRKGKDGRWIPAEVGNDDRPFPYSGCYVNAVLRVAGYDNKSKGVAAYISVIQFAAHGESFGATAADPNDYFDDDDVDTSDNDRTVGDDFDDEIPF